MPSIDRARLRRTFEHKCGATFVQTHHTVYEFRAGERLLAKTYISHARGDEDARIVARMAKQLRITPSQLKALVDCNLSADEFYAILVAKAPQPRS